MPAQPPRVDSDVTSTKQKYEVKDNQHIVNNYKRGSLSVETEVAVKLVAKDRVPKKRND